MKYRMKRKSPKKLFMGGLTGNQGGGQSEVGGIMSNLGGIANMIPGWGQAVAGGLNMVGGVFDEEHRKKEAMKANEAAEREARTSMNRGAFKDIPVGGGTLAMGGSLLKEYNAPTHAQGGQMVDQNGNPAMPQNAVAEIEKDETIGDGYAFSPNLKNKDGMTFADKSKKIENKYKTRIMNGDDISRRTRDKEMGILQDANDMARQRVQAFQTQQSQQRLAQSPMMQALAQQQQEQQQQMAAGPQGQPAPMGMAYGGSLKKLNPGGPILGLPNIANIAFAKEAQNTPYFNPEYNYDDIVNLPQFGGDVKKIQQAMLDYSNTTGDKYDFGGVDNVLGKKTKGFFKDPARREGFMKQLGYMQRDTDEAANIKGGFYSPYRESQLVDNPNFTMDKLPPPTNIVDTSPRGVEARRQMNLTGDDYQNQMIANIFSKDTLADYGSTIPAGGLNEIVSNLLGGTPNLINKSGKNVPMSTQTTTGGYTPSPSVKSDKKAPKEKKEGDGKTKEFFKNLQAGKLDSIIGAGLKGAETIGSLAMAFREPEKIKKEFNLRSREAEETLSKRGQALTKARQDSLRGLAGAMRTGSNAMSNAVKLALTQKAFNDYSNRGIDIAAKEKGLTDQMAGQLGMMQSQHGAADRAARVYQEVQQSMANAKSADAVKTAFETTGNLGEFFAKKGATSKKAQEQLTLLNAMYGNVATTNDITEYNKAIAAGDIDGILKFKDSYNLDLSKLLAEDLTGLTDAQKAQLMKKNKSTTTSQFIGDQGNSGKVGLLDDARRVSTPGGSFLLSGGSNDDPIWNALTGQTPSKKKKKKKKK